MSERGSASILALALLMGGTLLVGLAADVARFVAGWREASAIAHRAAEAGAGWVQPEALYEGRLEIDTGPARSAAGGVITGSGSRGTVDVTPSRVCATVEAVVEPGLIGLVGAVARSVEVTACAEPRQG